MPTRTAARSKELLGVARRPLLAERNVWMSFAPEKVPLSDVPADVVEPAGGESEGESVREVYLTPKM